MLRGQWLGVLNTAVFRGVTNFLTKLATISFSITAHLFCTRSVTHGTRSRRFQTPRYWRPSAGTPQNHRRSGRRQSSTWCARKDVACRQQTPATEAQCCTRPGHLLYYSGIMRPANLHGVTFQITTLLRTPNVSFYKSVTSSKLPLTTVTCKIGTGSLSRG